MWGLNSPLIPFFIGDKLIKPNSFGGLLTHLIRISVIKEKEFRLDRTYGWQDLAALSPEADALVRSYFIDAWLWVKQVGR